MPVRGTLILFDDVDSTIPIELISERYYTFRLFANATAVDGFKWHAPDPSQFTCAEVIHPFFHNNELVS
jgi:hypothetical protein